MICQEGPKEIEASLSISRSPWHVTRTHRNTHKEAQMETYTQRRHIHSSMHPVCASSIAVHAGFLRPWPLCQDPGSAFIVLTSRSSVSHSSPQGHPGPLCQGSPTSCAVIRQTIHIQRGLVWKKNALRRNLETGHRCHTHQRELSRDVESVLLFVLQRITAGNGLIRKKGLQS